jgi:uncharacterized protein YggT (Ycf19 family)
MEEPSVLDYLKQKLDPKNWSKKTPIDLPEVEPEEPPQIGGETPREPLYFSWRSLLVVGFALAAQRLLEPQLRNVTGALLLYAAAVGMMILALLKHEWQVPEIGLAETKAMDLKFKPIPFLAALPFMLVTFLTMNHNTFTALNVTLWIITILLSLMAFWQPRSREEVQEFFSKIIDFIKKPFLHIHPTGWNMLVAAAFVVGAYFHLSQLASVPLEMTSDHIEKFLNISEILNGKYSIFMPTNGGREVIQFYLSAILIKWFGAGMTFTTLKLGMALAFLFGLIYVYKLGKELGNRWTGLLAMLFMGFAQWPNIIARVGLRLVLCPVFVAPVMYYLIKGLRTGTRNHFVIAGIFLGLGLMGYSAFRIMPLVVVVGVLLYLLHQRSKQERKQGWWGLGVVTIFAIILALPMLRYATEFPQDIAYRTVTRMTSAEVPLAGNVVLVFLSNTWNAMVMPFWKDGSTWFLSVTDRPGLDVVTAAFYFIGLVIVFVRWLRRRNWQDMFLLVSIPLLMLPSILALAFPNENPSPSRLGGAVVPIIIIAVMGLQGFLAGLWLKAKQNVGKVAIVILALLIVFFSAKQNYTIVFDQYKTSYANATWNSKEIGEVCKDFIDSVGTPETCYVSGLAYWVDTRLVAVAAGYPNADFALWPKDFETSLVNPNAKMFIVKADQADTLVQLQQLYPLGFAILHKSPIEGRDFYAFLVPPTMP